MDSKSAVRIKLDTSITTKLIITDWRLDHSLSKVNLTVHQVIEL